MSEKLDISLWWLRRFFTLIPCQPGTKQNVATFGPKAKTIKTSDEARRWFDGDKPINLAVAGYPGALILDFDDPGLYQDWAEACPAEALTYTEQTPRGGYHVFAWHDSPIPNGMTLKPGIEIKDSVIVAPSIVNHRPYIRGAGELLEVDPVKIFTPLSVPGARTPHLLANIERVTILRHFGKLSQVKKAISPLSLLSDFRPAIKPAGRGRWLTCLCPFHNDREPSFWIDTQRGLWGCHACGLHGDVINLYAQFENLTNGEALQRLADRLGL